MPRVPAQSCVLVSVAGVEYAFESILAANIFLGKNGGYKKRKKKHTDHDVFRDGSNESYTFFSASSIDAIKECVKLMKANQPADSSPGASAQNAHKHKGSEDLVGGSLKKKPKVGMVAAGGETLQPKPAAGGATLQPKPAAGAAEKLQKKPAAGSAKLQPKSSAGAAAKVQIKPAAGSAKVQAKPAGGAAAAAAEEYGVGEHEAGFVYEESLSESRVSKTYVLAGKHFYETDSFKAWMAAQTDTDGQDGQKEHLELTARKLAEVKEADEQADKALEAASGEKAKLTTKSAGGATLQPKTAAGKPTAKLQMKSARGAAAKLKPTVKLQTKPAGGAAAATPAAGSEAAAANLDRLIRGGHTIKVARDQELQDRHPMLVWSRQMIEDFLTACEADQASIKAFWQTYTAIRQAEAHALQNKKTASTGHAAVYIGDHPKRKCYACDEDIEDRDLTELKNPGAPSRGCTNATADQFKDHPWCMCGHVLATICLGCASLMVDTCSSCFICKSPVRAWSGKHGGLRFRADAAINRVYKCNCSKVFRSELAVAKHISNNNIFGKGCSVGGNWCIIANDD